MIIFITIPWFRPAFRAGGPIQSVANLVSKFTEGIEYRIFCGNTDLNGEQLKGVETDQWSDFNDHTKVWYASADISKTITHEIEVINPDVLFMIGIFSWHYNIVPLFFAKAQRKILSVRGMLHEGALAQKKLKKKIFLQSMKVAGITKKVLFHATDEAEAGFIKNVFGDNAEVAVAGNYGRAVTAQQPVDKQSGSLKMVTVALISPMKNHLKVLQAISKSSMQIEYNIYGPVKDEAYWKLCLQEINAMPENISVAYKGETDPSNVTGILGEHHVFIMPSESENFGHSIYESLSAGRPVITSRNTPWNGLLAAKAGINIDVDHQSILQAVDMFAKMDNEEYQMFSTGAAAYVRSSANEEELNNQYKKLFQISGEV